MKSTTRHNGRVIRQNRPGYRKEVLKRHSGGIKYKLRGRKIKGPNWEKVKAEGA